MGPTGWALRVGPRIAGTPTALSTCGGPSSLGGAAEDGEDFCCWETSDFLSLSFSSSSSFSCGGPGGAGGLGPPPSDSGGEEAWPPWGSGASTQGLHFFPWDFSECWGVWEVRLPVWPATDSHRLLQCPGHKPSSVLIPRSPLGGYPSTVPSCSFL